MIPESFKLPPDEISGVITSYYLSHNKRERLGQFLVNTLCLRTNDPKDTLDLFYTTNDREAIRIVYEKFCGDT